MAKSKSLTVLTVVSSVFALQACTEGAMEDLTAPDGTLSNLSSQVSPETSEIVLGAANPTGTNTTIPITPGTTSNTVINNITVLPTPSPPPDPDEELDPNLEPHAETDSELVTDTTPETDSEVVTDTTPETDSEVVTDTTPETDSEIVTDTTPETDSEVVTDTTPETDSEVVTEIDPEIEVKEIASVDYTPVLEAPAGGELVPFGSTIQFTWSIPVSLLGTVTGFDLAIADSSEGVVSYRDNQIAISGCSDVGLCTHEINSADLPIPEGDNNWSVSSLGNNVSSNLAVATFTLDKDPAVQIVSGLSFLSPAADYTADSSSVDFAWGDPSKPDAVYDLHVYSDSERTQKVTGTNGVVFDTNGLGSETSYTFTNDPSNGARRYGMLWQWSDAAYDPNSKQEIPFEYTAYTAAVVDPPPVVGGADYNAVKALTDIEWAINDNPSKFDMEMTNSTTRVHPYYTQPVMSGAAMYYRTTGDTNILDIGIKMAQRYIDAGVDVIGNGFKDWKDSHGAYPGETIYNYDHHEWRVAMGIADMLIEMKRTGYNMGRSTRIQEWHDFLRVHVWDKWKPENYQSNTSRLYIVSHDGGGTWYNGRNIMIALALDQTHATPGNNEYFTWLNDPDKPAVKTMTSYITMFGPGTWQWPVYSNGTFNNTKVDTEHPSDYLYPMMRSKMLGYDLGGKIDEFLAHYELHLNQVWFPTSAGMPFYSDGTGTVNGGAGAAADRHILSAGISTTLQDRWTDHVLNHKPTFSFYDKTGHNPYQAVMLGSNLMWALNGGTL